jgi:syntaxin 1A
MIKDRLSELRAIQIDNKLDEQIYSNPAEFIEEFRKKVDEIQTNLNEIKKFVNELIKLYNSILSAPTTDNKVNEELKKVTDEIKKNSEIVRQKLRKLEADTNKDKYQRIRQAQISYLLASFTNILCEYNVVQIQHRDNCKERIRRQLQISGRQISEREVETLVDSENLQIFTQAMLEQTKRSKQTLQDVEDRNKEILKLEKSIMQVKEMFQDVHMLIESQGIIINNIEHNFVQSEESSKVAAKNIEQALLKKRKARKKKIGLAIAGSIALTVALIFLL